MEITLTDIEKEAYKDSPVHRLDGRVKLLAMILIIIFTVSLPRVHEDNLMRLAFVELYLIALMALAKLNPVYVMVRFLAVLPFGLGIIVIQPFVRQPFFGSFTEYPIDLPLGLTVTYEGLAFGITLLAKFIVCISAIILLSSTTKMHDIVGAARQLGIPKEIALLLTMMVRYLFLFWSVLKRIRTAQKCRLFNIWNKKVRHRWILEQIGYTISSIFVMAYEQGERTYVSMLCRGCGQNGNVPMRSKDLKTSDVLFSVTTLAILVASYLLFIDLS
ncbi:cobalt ECF transporter T component CbiQ [Methanomethylovorans sp.]|uniref:cobalt ECF transporter T component CbiQ n=1 Tax=Methanomethylovorans sp. TaxID=2758717 RepID=UPI00351BF196